MQLCKKTVFIFFINDAHETKMWIINMQKDKAFTFKIMRLNNLC